MVSRGGRCCGRPSWRPRPSPHPRRPSTSSTTPSRRSRTATATRTRSASGVGSAARRSRMDEPARSTTDGPYGERDPFDWLGAVLGPRVDELRALLDELAARWPGAAVRVGEGTRHRLRDVVHELALATRADW